MPTTTRWGIRYPASIDPADVPADLQRLASDLDGVAMDDQGPLTNRPVSSPGTPGKRGRYYYATDNGTLYRDFGTGWTAVNPAEAADGPAGTPTLRSLGTGALQAAAGNDPRLSDQRVPTDGSVTAAKVANALKPSAGAGAGTEALRALGTAAGTAAAGSHAAQHLPNGADSVYPTVVTTLPTTGLYDGREHYLRVSTADGGAGMWHVRYDASESGTYKWHVVGGPPVVAMYGAEVFTSVSTWTTVLGVANPTLNVPRRGIYEVSWGGEIGIAGSGAVVAAQMSISAGGVDYEEFAFSVTATSTTAVVDVASKTAVMELATTGETIGGIYRVTGGATASYRRRWICIRPIRIA